MEGPCDIGHKHEHIQTGIEEKIGDLDNYIVGSTSATKGVILAYDIFGFKQVNTRKFADKLAANGFFTIMPDFLRGAPWSPETDREKFREWLTSIPQDKFTADMNSTINYLHSKSITKIGIVGFCWGGKQALIAAIHNSNIKTIVSIHGSRITAEEVAQSKVPALYIHAEKDAMYTEELVHNIKAKIAERSDCAWKQYPAVAHGFALRGDPNDAVVVKAAEDAFNDASSWFASHL